MAQETIMREVLLVDSSKKASPPAVHGTAPNATDDHLWDCAIEQSLDEIRELADKALADRRAGRTKKITL